MKRIVQIVQIAIAMLALSVIAAAQFGTTISSNAQTLWNNYTVQGSATLDVSPVVTNSGQTSFQFHVIVGGNPNDSITISAEGSGDGVNWEQVTESVRISSVSCCSPVNPGTVVLEGGGYWPNLRLHITASSLGFSPVPTVTAFVTDAGSPLPPSGLVAAPANNSVFGQYYTGRASTVTTAIPAYTFLNTACNATPQDINPVAGVPGVIYGGHAWNPNNVTEFVMLGIHGFLIGGEGYLVAVPPNSGKDFDVPSEGFLPFNWGLTGSSSPALACSSSTSALTNPATNLVVTVLYKQMRTVNANITTGGTVNSTVLSIPY